MNGTKYIKLNKETCLGKCLEPEKPSIAKYLPMLADNAVQDVLPQGHAFGASAPEVMSASEKVKKGLTDDQCKINGCAADMWSAGTVLYEMLTGQRAFNPTMPEGNIPPASNHNRDEWPRTVLQQTELLVSLAQGGMLGVNHPHTLSH